MRTLALALALVLVAALMAAGGAEGNRAFASRQDRVRGPFLLVSLASLGTVTWGCDPATQGRLALGFRAFASSADVATRLVVGTRTVTRTHGAPGSRVNYPYRRARLQKLEIIQATRAGTPR